MSVKNKVSLRSSSKSDSSPDTDHDQTHLLEVVLKNLLSNDEFISLISKQIKQSLDQLTKQVEINQSNIHDLSLKVDQSTKDLHRSATKIEDLEDHKQQLSRDINNLEQYTRRNNLRIFGIPEMKGEKTNLIVKEMASDKLGINLEDTDIDRSHRVGQGEKRAIIVKLTRHDMKTKLIQARRKLKGSKIVIREDLTRENAILLKAAWDSPKTTSTWSTDGRVFAIKHGSVNRNIIRNLADIEKL